MNASGWNADFLGEGLRVLRLEAEALQTLAAALDENFSRAAGLILGLAGRVAVTGMGKSGHVARKVAATLASTGTPAYFIHPAEANHGDLGMISIQDAVLAFSNSGETEEMHGILAFCARHLVPVIGVSRRPASFLAGRAKIFLRLPDLPEACPNGCAPTTSTAMMMALGDALALALLTARGFTPENFQQYHPGGSLGRRLLKVADIMHTGEAVPRVGLDSPMPEVLFTMTGKSFGCTAVVDGAGRLAGVITDGDLRRHMKPDFLALSAADIMTRGPVTVAADTPAAEALGLMQSRAITTVFVLDGPGGRPAGLLHILDCLRAGLQ
ncbi:MAG: KpsF/GutQ family sugar-phosphate isomerase [Candidatus Adiutrix sp.]|jgi:arabinose-5-phosphate isomerase|nr:KpsF/GutQ family sugar-phosphate isomerase [Candidatus Adiutrix sp.]